MKGESERAPSKTAMQDRGSEKESERERERGRGGGGELFAFCLRARRRKGGKRESERASETWLCSLGALTGLRNSKQSNYRRARGLHDPKPPEGSQNPSTDCR